MIEIVLGAVIGGLAVLLVVAGAARRPQPLTPLAVPLNPAGGDLASARAEADRLRATLDHLDIGVVVVDAAGEVLVVNASARRMAGDRPREPVMAAALDRVSEEATQGRRASEVVEVFGPPHRAFDLTGAPLVEGAVIVIDDITERRRIDAIRRDFVSNISHELRTPVGALAVLAEALAESATDEDPDLVRRLGSRIDLEARRLTAMVDDLLSLAGIEADDHQRHVAVPMQQVVAEAVERIEPSARARNVVVEVLAADPALFVLGDRPQLVSAVHNLLENAVKYSDKGLPVSVEARRAPDSADHIEVRVVDHGIGIPSADIERIFERFYRVDRARTRDTGGTGLGLAIVRHVAVNHEGIVHVDSYEGEGSTFTLRLPAGATGAVE